MPPASVENEANFQLQEEYTRWEAVSPGSGEKIPRFHANFPGFTRKTVEHSPHLLTPVNPRSWSRFITSYTVAYLTAGLLFGLGILLILADTHPGNIFFTGICFLFVSSAIFVMTLSLWIFNRYDRPALHIAGILLAMLLFSAGVAFFLATFLY